MANQYLNEHDVLLNFMTKNINTLFNLIEDYGFQKGEFSQEEERWGGDDYPMKEEQRNALRISWKANPQYKFVWHEANKRTQTYYEPKENAAFNYNKNYSIHNDSGILIIGEVNKEFNNWLIELKKRLAEEKIAMERLESVQEKQKQKIGNPAITTLPKIKPQYEKEDQSDDLIGWGT